MNNLIEVVDSLEVRVFDVAAREMARELSVTKRGILAYRRIVRPQIQALELLEKKEYPFLKVDPDVYFGDLADHMRRTSVELEDLKEVIESLHDTHVSLTTHHTNEVIRTLTIIATIMLPLSVLSGLFGMNVGLPLNDWRFAFPMIIALMALVVGGMLIFFRSRRWF